MKKNANENSPFGPEGDKPLKETGGWNGFNFKDDLTLNQLFNSIDWKKGAEEQLKREKIMRIVAVISLVILILLSIFLLPLDK